MAASLWRTALFLFLLGFISLRADKLDNLYCDFTPMHTLCLFQGLGNRCGSQVMSRGNTPQDAKLIVTEHNRRRAKVAVGLEMLGAPGPQTAAANMRVLEWDEELAKIAQRLADQCIFEHDCADCRRFHFDQNKEWSRVIKGWFDEVKDFNSDVVSNYKFDPATGHYTQMLWATTTHVGCGFTMFFEDGWWKKLYVCNYGPAGNTVGEPLYIEGQPCAICPPGTTCSLIYPGLCESTDQGTHRQASQPTSAPGTNHFPFNLQPPSSVHEISNEIDPSLALLAKGNDIASSGLDPGLMVALINSINGAVQSGSSGIPFPESLLPLLNKVPPPLITLIQPPPIGVPLPSTLRTGSKTKEEVQVTTQRFTEPTTETKSQPKPTEIPMTTTTNLPLITQKLKPTIAAGRSITTKLKQQPFDNINFNKDESESPKITTFNPSQHFLNFFTTVKPNTKVDVEFSRPPITSAAFPSSPDLPSDLMPFLERVGVQTQVIRTNSLSNVMGIINALPRGTNPMVLLRTREGELMEVNEETISLLMEELASTTTTTTTTPAPSLPKSLTRAKQENLLHCDLDEVTCEITAFGGNWTMKNDKLNGIHLEMLLQPGKGSQLVVEQMVTVPFTETACISVIHRRGRDGTSLASLPQLQIGIWPLGRPVIQESLEGTPGVWQLSTVVIAPIRAPFLVVLNVGPNLNDEPVSVSFDNLQVKDGICENIF